MTKERLDYIKASQKRMGIHGKTKRFTLINELLTEIDRLTLLIDISEKILEDQAKTVMKLRTQITELWGDLPMIGKKE